MIYWISYGYLWWYYVPLLTCSSVKCNLVPSNLVLRISSVFLCTSSLVSPTPPVPPVSPAPSINWDITSTKEPRDNNETTWLRGEGKRGRGEEGKAERRRGGEEERRGRREEGKAERRIGGKGREEERRRSRREERKAERRGRDFNFLHNLHTHA